MMFAILGVSLMKNKLFYCRMPEDSKFTVYEVREQ